MQERHLYIFEKSNHTAVKQSGYVVGFALKIQK